MDQTKRIIPCVLLAANRRHRGELSAEAQTALDGALLELNAQFGDRKFERNVNTQEGLEFRDPSDKDGSNGSGGGTGGLLRPELSRDRFGFYDFHSYPGDAKAITAEEGLVAAGKQQAVEYYDRAEQFPYDLRIQLCIRFDSFGQAAAFLNSGPCGNRLRSLFEHVLIVPYFENTAPTPHA